MDRNPEWRKKYSKQIADMSARGCSRKLTQDELNSWKGPVGYLCHLAVLNPKSPTTPVRIVFNSSYTCKGVSLNSISAKGLDCFMNTLLGVLLRWREYPEAFICDISKMFHCIGTDLESQHLHRFMFRESPGSPIETYQ